LAAVFMGDKAQALPQPVRWSASGQTQANVASSKKEVLAQLKTLQDKQIAEGNELEGAIRKQLNETLKLEVGGDDLDVAGRRTNLVTKKIDELNKRRAELNARREIVDRLIFQIDSKWDGHAPLKAFLTQTFIEMASTDLSEGRDNRLWKEFTYLSMVMREVPERNEDVVSIFEGYLNYSSVLDPKTPAEFMATRNYTNGLESAQAHATDRSSVGDGLGPNSPSHAPNVIRTTIAKDMVPQPPPAETPASSTAAAAATSATDGTLSATTQGPPQAPRVATAPTPIAKTKVETAEKAQLDSGQVPMTATAPAGKADGKDAAPKSTTAALRANSETTATTQSASDLAAHAQKTPGVTPTPVPPVPTK